MAAVFPWLLLTVLANSEAQLQFTSDSGGDSDSDMSPCKDWKNEPDTVLWNALLKEEIIVDYLAWQCKTTPSSSQCDTPTSCVGCLHRVQFSSARYPLNFTHPVNVGDGKHSTYRSIKRPKAFYTY